MGLSQLEICNHALLKVGADTIDTLTEPTSSADGTKRSISLCNTFFDQAYEEVLRLYPWNSAKTRTTLTLSEVTDYPEYILVYNAGTSSVNGAYTYDIDRNGKPSWSNGSYTIQYATSVSGNRWVITQFGNSYEVLSGDGNVPPKTGWEVVDGSSPVPILDYFSGFGYTYYAKLPSDLIRLVDLFRYEDQRDERTAWVVEGGYVMSDYDTMYLKYIAKPTDTTELEPLCTNAVICNLALKLCTALQLDDDWAGRISDELYGRILPSARSIDTMENKELLLEESSWVLNRNNTYPTI